MAHDFVRGVCSKCLCSEAAYNENLGMLACVPVDVACGMEDKGCVLDVADIVKSILEAGTVMVNGKEMGVLAWAELPVKSAGIVWEGAPEDFHPDMIGKENAACQSHYLSNKFDPGQWTGALDYAEAARSDPAIVAAREAAEKVQRVIEVKAKEASVARTANLEMLAAAFLKETGLQPSECELVEEQRGYQTVWYFRKR